MKLSEMSEPQPTKDMLDYYIKRTKDHINRVDKNLNVVAPNVEYGDELRRRGKIHDSSKYEPPEREGYIWLTEWHRLNNEKQKFDYPPGIEEKVKAATYHHIRTNDHHPEAHEDVNDMSDADIAEMVCDWTAMSQELEQDGGSAKGWADKNVGVKWKFNEDRAKLIYDIISILDSEM